MINFSKLKLKKAALDHRLADVYIFGSRVSGFARDGSDLDVAVRFQDGLPKAEEIGRVYGELFADLSTCFPKHKLDLILLEEVPLHFQYKILTEGEMIFAKNLENSLNYQEKIFNLYRDQKYFIDEYFSGVLKVVGSR